MNLEIPKHLIIWDELTKPQRICHSL